MIISKKIENEHRNQIKIIKKEKNSKVKMKLIGSLVLDIGGRCISAVAKLVECCRKFVVKSTNFVKNGCEEQLKIETRGRKKLIIKYPDLEKDIKTIIEEYLLSDPHFKSEKLYVRLTVKEIKLKLIETGKYNEKSFNNSSLNNIINAMGYNLKKVKKVKVLKKIEKTDDIFQNVHERKEKAIKEKNTILISLDTKDKVLIGPFSRRGKNRIQVEAVDHELTNKCIVPFGILDIKKNIPYFFNFTSKPTSLDLVDCIEEFYDKQYKNTSADKIAILLDNGPDNSGVRTIFLKGLVDVSKKYNIKIELIYYPPYHSKYNPVERLWARIENIWNGYLLETVDICLNFMKNLTWKGNKSITTLKKVKYEKGMTINKKDMLQIEKQHISRKFGIEKWSVFIIP